jgi:hypothetical protein
VKRTRLEIMIIGRYSKAGRVVKSMTKKEKKKEERFSREDVRKESAGRSYLIALAVAEL